MDINHRNPSSPCTNDCEFDADSGVCRACFRTLDEIAEWGMMTAQERARVLESAERRRRAGGHDE